MAIKVTQLGVLSLRLNCSAATVRTGEDFYRPFGMGYSEFVAQDEQGYNIMKHYESCFAKVFWFAIPETVGLCIV